MSFAPPIYERFVILLFLVKKMFLKSRFVSKNLQKILTIAFVSSKTFQKKKTFSNLIFQNKKKTTVANDSENPFVIFLSHLKLSMTKKQILFFSINEHWMNNPPFCILFILFFYGLSHYFIYKYKPIEQPQYKATSDKITKSLKKKK